jgi:hypothetical protein
MKTVVLVYGPKYCVNIFTQLGGIRWSYHQKFHMNLPEIESSPPRYLMYVHMYACILNLLMFST